MTDWHRITKRAFYDRGSFANSNLTRKANALGRWQHYERNDHMTNAPKRRGRPPSLRTLDEEIAARRAARAKSKAKSKNVTLDSDALLLLYAAQKRLTDTLGFEPTLSQTLRAVLNGANK